MTKKLLSAALFTAATTMTSQAGLIALWDLEEGSGTTTTEKVSNTDSSAFVTGTSWNGTGGAPGSTDALSFAGTGTGTLGSNNGVSTGLNSTIGFSGSGAKTIMAWINTSTTVQDGFFSYSPTNGSGAGADIRLLVNGNGGDTTGKLRMEVSSGGFEFGSGLNDGNWHMIAVVINAGDGINDVDVYIDGTYTTRSGGGTLINTASAAASGGFNQIVLGSDVNAGRNYGGLLDDVAIFDTALTETELDDIRTNGITAVPEPSSTALLGLGGLALILRRRK